MYCDKLHVKSLKYILGVHKKAVNDAVLGETGRYPMYISIITQSTKYFSRLLESKPSSLLYSAFQQNCTLHKSNKPCWLTNVQFMLDKLKIDQQLHYHKNLSDIVKSRAINEFKMKWAERLDRCHNEQSGKLRTYSTFKKQFCFESYLTIVQDPMIKCLQI